MLGVVAIAIAIAVVSIAVGERSPQPPITGASETQQLFGGIAKDGSELGSADAPLSATLYTDLLCATCAEHYMALVPPLVEGRVRDGELRLTLRHFPLGESDTTVPALATIAAGFQDAGWQYAHLFFLNFERLSDRVTTDFLQGIARAVLELDTERWSDDVDSPEAIARAEAEVATVRELDLYPVPAVIVEGPEGTRELTGSPSLGEVEAALAEVR